MRPNLNFLIFIVIDKYQHMVVMGYFTILLHKCYVVPNIAQVEIQINMLPCTVSYSWRSSGRNQDTYV